METFLTPLTEAVEQMVADAAVITQNLRAMNDMGDDIMRSVQQHEHRRYAHCLTNRRVAFPSSMETVRLISDNDGGDHA